MSKNAVANRYAVALFQVAKQKGTLTETQEQLRTVQQAVKENPVFSEVLGHPKVTAEKKKEIFKSIFGKAVSDTVMNTFFVLIDHRRENVLLEMIDDFNKHSNEDQGIAEAKVYTTKAISEEDINTLTSGFAKKLGKKQLRVENIIDPELIGGIKIRIGDRIYDGSVKRQLQRLERQLVTGNVRR
ncbi:F0F1 ATP synthase subunit delta [Anaerobacillus sp. MEB173]|uniref:F0F1 ATP synthase subunit delta n=1 Tax=Anaerobacillus sp. MEB173 TaxID=3383345 RepID=UPI003F8EABE9